MNKLFAFIVLAIISLTACTDSDDNNVNNSSVTLSTEAFTAKAKGGDYQIGVTANTSWTAESNVDWAVIVEPKSGTGDGTITVRVEEYTGAVERTAQITVKGEGVDKDAVAIMTQAAGAEPEITVSTYAIAAEATAGTYTFNVTSNIEWSATVEKDKNWLSVTPATGVAGNNIEISVKVEENTDEADDRTAIITLSGAKAGSKTVTVTQARKFVQPNSGTWAYSNIVMVGNELKFAVTAEETDIYPVESQGLFFRWGSLVGLSPVGSYDASVAVFRPDGFTRTITDEWDSVPFLDKDNGKESYQRTYDQFITDYPTSGYDAASGLGDICRYISDKGWVKGKWRIPTSIEFEDLVATQQYQGEFATQYSNKTDGTYIMESGYIFDTGTNSRFFPASGNRKFSTGAMDFTGTNGFYWASSPGGTSNANNLGFINGFVNAAGNTLRMLAIPVRCVSL